MNAPESAANPATILNVIIQQASEKAAYAERMLPFARDVCSIIFLSVSHAKWQ